MILAVTGGATLPDARTLALLAGMTGFGIFAYNALTIAMRTGEVAAVTPFRYTRLLFAMVMGVMVFGERPDTATLLGIAPGHPLLSVERLAYTYNDEPMELRRGFYRTDAHHYRNELN